MIRTGSRSFFAASRLLPDRVRDGAYALYAFCRMSDDSVDVDGGGAAAVERLASRLDAIYRGSPANGAVDRALADAVEQFALPRTPFEALLEGLAWDAEGRGCEAQSELFAYAARVAGAVGAMMAALMGARATHMAARATDLGVAMQLTNIARDVGEDARLGRLYLPRSWMRDAGLDPDAWLAAPVFSPALASVVARVLATAEALYQRADAGIAALPGSFRPAIFAARRLYAEIGREVERAGHDSVSARAVVPAARKLALVASAFIASPRTPDANALLAPPLDETRFLVDAVSADREVASTTQATGAGLDWVIALFAALDERPRRVA